jgi:hypothetical protein
MIRVMRRRNFGHTRRVLTAGVAAVLIAVVCAGIVLAAIPDGNGVIQACYKKAGALRVVDAEAGGKCSPKETSLSWAVGGTSESAPPALASISNDGTLDTAASRGVSAVKVVEFEIPTEQPPQVYAICFAVSLPPVWGTTSAGGYLDVRTSSIASDVEELEARCGPGYNALGPSFGRGVGSHPFSSVRYI